jgi:RNA polymerase sigma-70 factor, ECF subfamily
VLMADDREAQYLRLLRTYDHSVRRLAIAYERDQALQQDLIQEIWLALWLALPSFRGDCREQTFVFRIAHNRAVSHIQQARRRRAEALDEESPIPDPRADPESAAGQHQRSEQLRAAVRQLPLGLRQVVVLTLEGLSNRETGEVLGLSESNVAVRLTRARAALRELITDGRGTS